MSISKKEAQKIAISMRQEPFLILSPLACHMAIKLLEFFEKEAILLNRNGFAKSVRRILKAIPIQKAKRKKKLAKKLQPVKLRAAI